MADVRIKQEGIAIMPEPTQYVFDYKEIATLLVKRANIREGLWGIFIRFGFGATNINTSEAPGEEALLPAAIASVKEIGIQRFEKPNNLTVDAAVVNPATEKAAATSKASKKKS